MELTTILTKFVLFIGNFHFRTRSNSNILPYSSLVSQFYNLGPKKIQTKVFINKFLYDTLYLWYVMYMLVILFTYRFIIYNIIKAYRWILLSFMIYFNKFFNLFLINFLSILIFIVYFV